MWVGSGVRRPTRRKQPIGAKQIMFSVCFISIGIVDIVILPPDETFDRSFFVDIVLGSSNKKFAQNTGPNPDKGRFSIWIMPDPIWPIMRFKQITSPGFPIQLTAQICPTSRLLGI
jgi:hypothetical protein